MDTTILSTLALLLDVNRTLAKFIAFALALVSNFLGNYLWAYRDSRSKPLASQALQFAGVGLTGMLVNLMLFSLADWAFLEVLAPSPRLIAAQLLGASATMLWSFLANRLVTFGDVRLGS